MNDIYGFGGVTLPVGWLAALATSDLRLSLYGTRLLYGLTRFLHLIGVGGFVGSIMLVELRMLGLWPDTSLKAMRGPLVWVMHVCFVLAIATGVLLFIYDPLGSGLHTMFVPKLALITLGLLIAHGGGRLARYSLRLRRVSAGVTLSIWIAVIGASTWNHVERPVNVRENYRASTIGR